MANDFTKDRNCVALWNFEDTPGFLVDSVGGNDLTNGGADEEIITIKEGSKAAGFVLANTDDMVITDANLDAGFPFRDADGASAGFDITTCFWIYLKDVPSVSLSNYTIWSKWISGNNQSVLLKILTSDLLYFFHGYNAGVSYEFDFRTTALVKDRWYCIGVGYREVDKSLLIRIWDDTAGAIHGTDLVANLVQSSVTENVDFVLGSFNAAGDYGNFILDELSIFNRKLSSKEMDKIREGTYNFSNFGNLALNTGSRIAFEGGG